MNDFQLNVNIREAVNGWLVEFTKGDDTVEYVYSRPGPAISFAKKVMTGDVEIFGDENEQKANNKMSRVRLIYSEGT